MFSPLDAIQLAMIGGVSFFGALSALLLMARLWTRQKAQAQLMLAGRTDELIFLFDDETLIDATEPARRFLETSGEAGGSWSQLLALLSPRYPTVASDMANLVERGSIQITPRDPDDKTCIEAEWWDGFARIALVQSNDQEDHAGIDTASLNAMRDEIALLRGTARHAPYLVWQQDDQKTITWANHTYLDHVAQLFGNDVAEAWPPKPLFETLNTESDTPVGKTWRGAMQHGDDGEKHWYDITSRPFGDNLLYFATPADDTVQAQASLREFIQTLSKTFAHLPIGLAIFDQSRQLSLFNPALTDLTTLSVSFLTARPTLRSFLDQLRDRQMIPEPKDYRSWRQQIAELEAGAENGTYADVWNLAGGLTYRVTGRPHPDGAIAFLIEDISAEVSLTRRFRAELDQSQAVIDTIDEAIAVFSSNGVLSLCNKAYKALWNVETDAKLKDSTVVNATTQWQARALPTPIWGDLRDFVGASGDRVEWSAPIHLKDGRLLTARFAPLSGGATLVGFSFAEPTDLSLRPTTAQSAQLACGATRSG